MALAVGSSPATGRAMRPAVPLGRPNSSLGQVLTDLHEKPGQLRDILGDGSGSQPQEQAPGSNPIVDMPSSPLAKAVLAGIAAVVVKRMTGSSSQA
jgi:hypothetical protein